MKKLLILAVILAGSLGASAMTEIRYIYFGGYSCGACKTPEMKEANAAAIATLRKLVEARGWEFESVCAVIDPDDPEARGTAGGETVRVSVELQEVIQAEASHRDQKIMRLRVEPRDDLLLRDGQAARTTERLKRVLLREARERGWSGRPVCIRYDGYDNLGFGRASPLEDKVSVRIGCEEFQIGRYYADNYCGGYDRVVFTGEQFLTEEFQRYVLGSPARFEYLPVQTEGLPYVTVVSGDTVLLRALAATVLRVSHDLEVWGKSRISTAAGEIEVIDCFFGADCPTGWARVGAAPEAAGD